MPRLDGGQMRTAETDEEFAGCFDLMRELRPHLNDVEKFVQQMGRQKKAGYVLLVCYREDVPAGLAGYRLTENTVHGPFVYVDDLVVTETLRGSQVGADLLDAVSAVAREHNCRKLVLDTGLQNSLAQRFYFRYGLLATGLHFVQSLEVKN